MMRIPSSTYRIQLHKGFPFSALGEILGYLEELGVDTVYASPVTAAIPGSTHGYDVIDARRINPEIGTMEELELLARRLQEKNMGWLQDIVPNHMAATVANPWFFDVLERGERSPYHRYFDIDWQHPASPGQVMLPVLGAPPEEFITNKQLLLKRDEAGIGLSYGDARYPLSAETRAELESAESLDAISSDPAAMREMLRRQHYRLVCWKDADSCMNYRRFFAVNDLISLNMQLEQVRGDWHRLLAVLCEKGLVQGVRIDHIDGLADPRDYCHFLRRTLGDDCYIVAEKILALPERLPADWNIEGTTGYDQLAFVNQVMTDHAGATRMLEIWRRFTGSSRGYRDMVFENKHRFLREYLAGELDNLVRLFDGSLNNDDGSNTREALSVLLACFPVYRLYPDPDGGLSRPDRDALELALEDAAARAPQYCGFYERFAIDPPPEFLRRMMQFTGPLAAKGVEDTTFYVYNALINHNEVGDDPEKPGIAVGAFHQIMAERQKESPWSLNATSTHDTKRGEDARARIGLLANDPEKWQSALDNWSSVNKDFLSFSRDRRSPSRNDEYFFYQSLIGACPQNLQIGDEFRGRTKEFLVKAMREAKAETQYDRPDDWYESSFTGFADSVLAHKPFLDSFRAFMSGLLPIARKASLVQAMLKLTLPGVPDVYQGAELWDFSYVDPDNRRPVDYPFRRTLLKQLLAKKTDGFDSLLRWLHEGWEDGREKLYLTHTLLLYRRKEPALFSDGGYEPLDAGADALVFARRKEDRWLIAAAPLRGENPVRVKLPATAPRHWVNLLTGAKLIEENGELLLDEQLTAFPVACLRPDR